MTRLEKFTKVIEKNEGGYCWDKNDSGGETYAGISRKNWPNWAGWQIVDAVKEQRGGLKLNEFIQDEQLDQLIAEFYEENFYKKLQIAYIVEPLLALHVFDMGVNSGVANAAKMLQRLINELTTKDPLSVDGKIGPKTIQKVNSYNQQAHLADLYCIERREYYEEISKKGQNAKFLDGWFKRITNTTKYLG